MNESYLSGRETNDFRGGFAVDKTGTYLRTWVKTLKPIITHVQS